MVIPDHNREVRNPDERPIGRKAVKKQTASNGPSGSASTLLEKLAEQQKESLANDQWLIDELKTYNQHQEELIRLKRQKINLLRATHAQNSSSNERIDCDSE